MSLNINEAVIAGNLCQDPELRTTPSGSQVVALSVATNERWKDKSGNDQSSTEYHRAVFWEKKAETICKFLKKGDPIYIRGKIVTKSWEKDGVKKYATEIQGLSFQFLGQKKEGQQQGGYQQKPQNQGGNNFQGGQPQQGQDDMMEDDVPF